MRELNSLGSSNAILAVEPSSSQGTPCGTLAKELEGQTFLVTIEEGLQSFQEHPKEDFDPTTEAVRDQSFL